MRGGGALSAVAVLAVVAIPLAWIWPARGLTATFHANTEWLGEPAVTVRETRLTAQLVEERQFTLPQQRFSLLMVGWLRVDTPGEYGFSSRSDDGSTLDVAGVRVVDNGGYHAARTASGRITLDRGFHPIRLRYIQGTGSYSLSVRWTPPGGEESIIPAGVLYPAEPALPRLALLVRHAGPAWAVAWAVLALLVLGRVAGRAREPVGLRTAVARGALLIASTLITLVVLELGLRAVRFTREDRRPLEERLAGAPGRTNGTARVFSLGDIVQPSPNAGIVYELKPNLRGIFQGKPLATNSRGLRDAEHGPSKPPGTVRVAALGDSSLFGWGVAAEDATCDVLERLLNDAPGLPAVEVINFATPGYNTAIQAEVFERKVLAYDPDVLLINFNTNDYDVPAFMRLPDDYATLRKSFLFDVAYLAYTAWRGVPPRELPVFDFTTRTLTLDEADRLDEDPGLPDEYRYMVGARGFERAIDRIVTLARGAGVQVVVYDARPFPGLHPTYAPNALRDSQRDLLERLSREKGFHWLNTYPAYVDYLRANPEARFPRVFAVSDSDSHPSELAHGISARAVFEFLVGQRLVSRD